MIRSKFTKNCDHEDQRQVEGEDREIVFRNIRQRPGRSNFNPTQLLEINLIVLALVLLASNPLLGRLMDG